MTWRVTLKRGAPSAAGVVKRSRVLDEIEADVPYEETRLAKRAPAARKRLAGVLLLGAIALAIEAVATDRLWAVPALGVAAAAWGVRRARLGGLVAAGFAALVAALLGIAFLASARPTGADLVAALVALALGAMALPDVLTLARDAELQNAYGLWARREA